MAELIPPTSYIPANDADPKLLGIFAIIAMDLLLLEVQQKRTDPAVLLNQLPPSFLIVNEKILNAFEVQSIYGSVDPFYANRAGRDGD